jgi:hydroxypyruvate isomerase
MVSPVAALPQSFAWWTFFQPDSDPRLLLAEAAAIGYRGVEIVDERYWPLVHEAGLDIVAICGQESQQHGLNNPRNHADLRREILENLALARDNGIRSLILFVGEHAGDDDQAAIGHTVDCLAPLVVTAAQADVTLLVEPMNSKVDHPGHQCDRLSWALRVVEALDAPQVKIAYDIYHMQIMEGDIIRTIQRHHAQMGHIQTAGVPGRGNLDGTQELNFPAIARMIATCGYPGFVGHEFFPAGDPIAALREAFQIFDVAPAG